MSAISDKLVWCDLETTGIEDHDIILEYAIVVTDNNLEQLGHLTSVIIDCNPNNLIPAGQPRTKDGQMPCYEAHFEAPEGKLSLVGLLQSMADKTSVDPWSVEFHQKEIVAWLEEFGIREGMEGPPPLCGSSIHFDRRFLRRHMPSVEKLFHYRNIDVSALRELQRRWAPELELEWPESTHRALEDLRYSLSLLRFYRDRGFVGL